MGINDTFDDSEPQTRTFTAPVRSTEALVNCLASAIRHATSLI